TTSHRYILWGPGFLNSSDCAQTSKLVPVPPPRNGCSVNSRHACSAPSTRSVTASSEVLGSTNQVILSSITSIISVLDIIPSLSHPTRIVSQLCVVIAITANKLAEGSVMRKDLVGTRRQTSSPSIPTP